MNTLAIFNDENLSEEELASFQHKKKCRGVIFDSEHKVALLHIKSKGYYNLPGGGVEEDEDYRQTIIRECKEEIGCDITISTELGRILEYQKETKTIKESDGYVGTVIGQKGNRILIGDEDEAEKNATIVWVSLDEAIELMENTVKPERLYSQYILARDLAFLKEAQAQLS